MSRSPEAALRPARRRLRGPSARPRASWTSTPRSSPTCSVTDFETRLRAALCPASRPGGRRAEPRRRAPSRGGGSRRPRRSVRQNEWPMSPLPAWAEEMRQVFKAGATSQFVLHGNVFDLVPAADGKGGDALVSLTAFLTGTMFRPFDVVIRYDRGRGMRIEPPGSDASEPRASAARGPGSRRQEVRLPQGRRRLPRRPGRLRRRVGPGRQARPP